MGCAPFAEQLLEPSEVELVGLDRQHVARRLCEQYLRPKHLPELGDRVLERGSRRSRRLLAPHLVDQPLGRDRLVCPQEQEGEHGALISAADRDRNALRRHLERSQDPEVEH
jgi:hypothetical protein